MGLPQLIPNARDHPAPVSGQKGHPDGEGHDPGNGILPARDFGGAGRPDRHRPGHHQADRQQPGHRGLASRPARAAQQRGPDLLQAGHRREDDAHAQADEGDDEEQAPIALVTAEEEPDGKQPGQDQVGHHEVGKRRGGWLADPKEDRSPAPTHVLRVEVERR